MNDEQRINDIKEEIRRIETNRCNTEKSQIMYDRAIQETEKTIIYYKEQIRLNELK